jgi:CelD/BcsL family acetyltransferase involved in cellulose biosynthesis
MASDVTVTRIEQRAQLSELQAEWNQLLDRTEVASPFLTPGWQLAWLDTYGARHKPFVLAARRAGELIGLWTMAIRRRGPFRVLEPLGAGRSDWLDVPAVTNEREAVLSAFLNYLIEYRKAWDLIELRDILADSPTIAILESLAAKGGLGLRRQLRSVAPYLVIRGSWEDYLASRSGNFRSSLRRRLKSAADPKSELAISVTTSPDSGAIVEVLADVERKSWKAQEGNLKLTTLVGREFYERYFVAFAAQGLLRIWTAAVQGAVVAYLVLFVHKGKCYYYNGAYDEGSANLSPGTVLHAMAIQDAFRMELAEYDFLSGEESFKDRWSTGRREIHHFAIFSGRYVSVAAVSVLVSLRWAFRRSKALREGRAWLLSIARRFSRAREPRG